MALRDEVGLVFVAVAALTLLSYCQPGHIKRSKYNTGTDSSQLPKIIKGYAWFNTDSTGISRIT